MNRDPSSGTPGGDAGTTGQGAVPSWIKVTRMVPPSPGTRRSMAQHGTRFDVSAFDLAETVAAGTHLRQAVDGAGSTHAAAQRLADFFRTSLVDRHGEPACAQARVFLARPADRPGGQADPGWPSTGDGPLAVWEFGGADEGPRTAGPAAPHGSAPGVAGPFDSSLLLRSLRDAGLWPADGAGDPAGEIDVALLDPDGERTVQRDGTSAAVASSAPSVPEGAGRLLAFAGPVHAGHWFAVALVVDQELPARITEFFRPLAHSVRLALLSAGEHSAEARLEAAGALTASTEALVTRRASQLQSAVTELRSTSAQLRRSEDELRRRESELREEAAVVELLQEVGSALAAELDLDTLVQHASDAATRLSGAAFGAFFYNVLGETGESYLLYVISGVDRSAFDKFPMPRNTQVFEYTFRGLGVVRSDDITTDPRYGHNAPHHGMPEGHLPVRSYLAVPVVSRGTVLGGFFFGHPEPGRFTERHERLVTGIASQAAIALQNAQTYRQEREAAMELQRRLLPTLPKVDGIVTTSRYLPAARSRGAGGDWMDLIPLPDGEVALVVGDVMGKGVRAAAIMGQIRTACRAYAQLGLAPSEVLEQLSVIVDDIAPGCITTCAYAVLDRHRSRLRLAVAGHLPPVLRDAQGSVRFLDEEIGPPLGVGRRAYPEQEAHLAPGARLLLYTDGLVERRSRPIDEGLRQLRKLLAGPVGEIEADCDSWLDTLAGGQHDDDIAMLYLYRPEDSAHQTLAVVREYPPVSGAVPDARDLVSRTMREWGLGHLANDLMLVTDEIVANAVRHARTPLRVELRRSADRVVLEVTDSSTRQPRLIVSRPEEFGHRGIFLVDAIAARWGTRLIDGGKVVWAEVSTS
ncbi:GAF domain-containing protein [Streptomyces galbus]|uniref:protein-serine/threonine phosphatase n=2 Tax=Streptomyces galbus TaxID=33898 RepID=A0A4U5W6F3_STRGB|nr:GAF domain-containing protein [Streptomyces galbus]